MNWVSVFTAFLVAHMVGDYLFQTDWQARHKRRGLSGGYAFREMIRHVTTYTIAFGDDLTAAWAVLAAALIFLPHLVLDDGRFIRSYMANVKRVPGFDVSIAASVDQSFHVLSLFLVALLVGTA